MKALCQDELSYYAQPAPLSDPGAHVQRLDGLPRDIASLCTVVQGLLLHVHWAPAYGVKLSAQQQREPNLRSLSAMLDRMLALDAAPLSQPRPLERRLVGNCRHFSLLLCSLLRHQGVPARARCGFGTYFTTGGREDHWVCEVWDAARGRWQMVDAQIDDLQRRSLQLDFDPTDMPAGRFLMAGEAWHRCRWGDADPQRFGIFHMRGFWFIRGNVVRDLAALNRVELLPWDAWGVMEKEDPTLTLEDNALVDRAAQLGRDAVLYFGELRALYESEPALRVPVEISTWSEGRRERVRL